jgi:predicted GNAT superfamily acetyltransferase
VSVRALIPDDYAWVVALNAENRNAVAPLDEDTLARRVETAFAALAFGDAGYLIALDQDVKSGGQHWGWFAVWFPKFVCVDQLVVGERTRRHGVGRALVQRLFDKARAEGHDRVFAHVRRAPSDAADLFAAKLGFEEIGQSVSGEPARYMMHKFAP